MNIDAFVTRPEIGGGNLELVTATYNFEGETGIEFGAVTWRRDMVTSPFVHGGIPVTQVKDNAQLTLTIQVKAADHEELQFAIAALIAAFSQFEYEMHIVYDSIPYVWKCYAADYAVATNDERMGQWHTTVKLIVPRSPVPLAGPI